MKILLFVAWNFLAITLVWSRFTKKEIFRSNIIEMEAQNVTESEKPNNETLKGRIINGKKVILMSEFPYQVKLQIKSKSLSTPTYTVYNECGGSILSNEWLLTAAHCLADALDGFVYIGCINVNKRQINKNGCQKLQILNENLFQHPNYQSADNNIQNDIGLVKFTSPINFTNNIKTIELNINPNVPKGQTVLLSGYGETETGNTSEDLKYTTVHIITNEQCKRSYPFIESSVICYETNGITSSCHGDSGGPMTMKVDNKVLLVGVTSFGGLVCQKNPGAYTRVSSYLQWICNKTKICYDSTKPEIEIESTSTESPPDDDENDFENIPPYNFPLRLFDYNFYTI